MFFLNYDERDPTDKDTYEIASLQDILDNFGEPSSCSTLEGYEGGTAVEYPEFYAFLTTAKVGESKSGMYAQGTYSRWLRII
tara:strand:- start:7 stop:252 length:246 start_codon:yes stop_codon:yes gene_type:complete